MADNFGTLHGIGVGPGDPDLITLKAVKTLQHADVVYTASSTKNSYSLAVSIAKPHIPEGTDIRYLGFPMSRDPDVLNAAWKENAQTVARTLALGQNAAFLTLGDCLTYSTYGYLARHVRRIAPEAKMVAIPGITSYHAAAARIHRPLAEGEQSLLIVSGCQGGGKLREMGEHADSVVFLKAYRNAADITRAIDERGWLKNSVGVKSCGLPEERIIENINDLSSASPDYWTVILSGKHNGHE
ncbi:MAG: precorrin-2 C(20)-methyltransferase [Desulfobacterales bacterium]|nr:precorrin-2 C(20)-methyltransferase [Desulfobacterales bacterium]